MLLGCEDGTYWLHLDTGRLTPLPVLHDGKVRRVAINHHDDTLVTAEQDGRVIKRRLDGAKVLEYPSHQEGITSMDLSPDGRVLATAGRDSRLHLSNLVDGTHHITWYGLEDRDEFLVTTPPDAYAGHGWIYTNAPHMIDVVDAREGHLPRVTKEEKRKEYLEKYHSMEIVRDRLNDFDRYQARLQERLRSSGEAMEPLAGRLYIPILTQG